MRLEPIRVKIAIAAEELILLARLQPPLADI